MPNRGSLERQYKFEKATEGDSMMHAKKACCLLALALPGLVAAQPIQLTEASCLALAGLQMSAREFSLPTTGATVESASWATTAQQHGNHCVIDGIIRPVDPAAPNIRWRSNLPEYWNHKALQYGGGGFNGTIPNTGRQAEVLGLANTSSPLARGFMTLAGDSGHVAANGNDASFATNAEALENFAYMHIKKTLDAATVVANAAYGQAPRRVYFSGGSTGGREGMTAALRWPESYDGIVANYPSALFMGLRLWGSALAQAVYCDDSAGWIPLELVERITARSIESCDLLDGAADGVVSNPVACRAQSQKLIDEFRCADDIAADGSCLTQVQIDRTIAIYHEGYELPYELANGIKAYKGYNSLEGVFMNVGTQPEYSEPVISGPHAHHSARAYEFFTYFVNTDGKLDFRTFDIRNPGRYQDRIVELSKMIDATDPDFSKFAARGGKLILVHGLEDASITPIGTAELYERIVASVGQKVARDFMRFYLVPGLAHGGGNFSPSWDNLAALDRWVETGLPPIGPVVTDATNSPTRGRTRPLCEYPAWPRYSGEGNVNSASSFRCVIE
jgi:feruloyl esterase